MRPNEQLAAIVKLYRPNVSNGNYGGDVFAGGRNEGLLKAAVAAGLETEAGMLERFRVADRDDYQRSEAAIERANLEARAERRGREQAARAAS